MEEVLGWVNFGRRFPSKVGHFCMPVNIPPEEPLPIPDYRTMAGRTVTRPSPNLLDMLYVCQERQSWYREYLRGANPGTVLKHTSDIKLLSDNF
jgi:hypothetical protein